MLTGLLKKILCPSLSPTTTDPSHANLTIDQALASIHEGANLIGMQRFAEAETLLRNTLRAIPQNADALNNLGIALFNQKKWHDAEAAFRQALHSRPDFVDARFNLAILLGSLKRAAEAEEAYRQVIHLHPDHANAFNNLGILLQNQNRLAEAERAFQEVARIRPEMAAIHNNLGTLYVELQRHAEAETAFREALRLQPDLAIAHYNLGKLLQNPDRAPEAEASYRQAIAIQPNHMDAHHNLGLLLSATNRQDEAEAVYRQALRIQPDHANLLCHLGILLQSRQRFPEAEEAYRQALRCQPDHIDAWFGLGNLLSEQKQQNEAAACFRKLLLIQEDHHDAQLNLANVLVTQHQYHEAESIYQKILCNHPNNANVLQNLGNAYKAQSLYERAEQTYRQAIRSKPDHVHSWFNLGNLMKALKRHDEAIEAYRQALAIKPDYVDAQWNLGLVYLSMGHLQEGWSRYELRYHPQRTDRNVFPIDVPFPMWQGEEVRGKALLIVHEQGFGDQIQFCRYVRVLRDQGAARITLTCHATLLELFRSLPGIDHLLPHKPPPTYQHHDYWVFYCSIPLLLGTTLSTIPAMLPYLHAPEAHRIHWGNQIPDGRFRVGLVWKGNPNHYNDIQRSLPDLAILAPLWTVAGVTFVSLQKMHGEEEALSPPPGQPLLALGHLLLDFADTAAVISHLDLVITIDSAVAHLTGALGKPCWVLLPSWDADFRWLHHREDSPWYPGVMRLFSQHKPGEWHPVIDRIRDELHSLVQTEVPSDPHE
ncbi:MAG: tetratricopeptide repeat protein [Magnetococcales bacterium]|nr:tetratricopeptide repeat protein [Magnetococcales bacterium]